MEMLARPYSEVQALPVVSVVTIAPLEAIMRAPVVQLSARWGREAARAFTHQLRPKVYSAWRAAVGVLEDLRSEGGGVGRPSPNGVAGSGDPRRGRANGESGQNCIH